MDNIYILGDIHGSITPIRKFHEQQQYSNNTLILLGDAGINYYLNKKDKKFKSKMEKFGITYFIIRGNHEERPSNLIKKDPNDWHTEIFWGNIVYVENDYPHIKYALDYPAIYKIPNGINIIKTLVIPGAYSVDKYYRIKRNWSWFKDEQLTKKEMDMANELIKNNYFFDLVLSHTCPAIYEPTDLYLSIIDQSLVDKTMERWLNQIEFKISYQLWCWGHYHALRIYPRVGIRDKVMLFNEEYFNLLKYFNDPDRNPYDALTKLI